tara:strand:- start:188 stop:361 length:174 start_codon:yes stop_codon:yes gene_type:complete
MKTKKLYLKDESSKKKELVIYLLAASSIFFLGIKMFYGFYLHNVDFHIFIQSKGIFL